jgi:hypothetical protein
MRKQLWALSSLALCTVASVHGQQGIIPERRCCYGWYLLLRLIPFSQLQWLSGYLPWGVLVEFLVGCIRTSVLAGWRPRQLQHGGLCSVMIVKHVIPASPVSSNMHNNVRMWALGQAIMKCYDMPEQNCFRPHTSSCFEGNYLGGGCMRCLGYATDGSR